MPGMDRKGPQGEGPRTGRGMGRCRTRVERKDEALSKNDSSASEELKVARDEVRRDDVAGTEAGPGLGRRIRNRFRMRRRGGRGGGGGGGGGGRRHGGRGRSR